MPSNVIEFADYNAGQRILDIKYRSGRIYRYFDVSEKTYHDYKNSLSKGRFLNAVIKKKHLFEAIK